MRLDKDLSTDLQGHGNRLYAVLISCMRFYVDLSMVLHEKSSTPDVLTLL